MNDPDDRSDRAKARLGLSLPTAPPPGPTPTLEEIADWRAGRLPEPRATEVKAHVARDPESFRLWRELSRAEAEAAAAEPGAVASRESPAARLWAWLRRPQGAGLAGTVAGVGVLALALRVALAPDLGARIDAGYDAWDPQRTPAPSTWPLYDPGYKSDDLFERLSAARRGFAERAFRAGMAAGLARLTADAAGWEAPRDALETSAGPCPDDLERAACEAAIEVLVQAGRWTALEQLRCASEAPIQPDAATAEALAERLGQVETAVALRERFDDLAAAARTGDRERYCEGVSELTRYGT